MSFNPPSKTDQRRAKFYAILPEYPAISTAPSSIMNVPGFFGQPDAKARDVFEDNFWQSELLKFYKAIDGAGVIWKMRNPAAVRWGSRLSRGPIDYGERVKLGHIDDFSEGSGQHTETKGMW